MNIHFYRKALIFLFLMLSVSACGLLGVRDPAPDASAIYTQAAQTIEAQYTQSAFQTAVAQLTQAVQPSATPTAPVILPGSGGATPTATQQVVLPTATHTQQAPTPNPPTATPTPQPCNRAQFVGDVTVADGSTYVPGAQFTKIWRLKNTGTCTWTPAYSLLFAGGTAMTSRTDIPLTRYVLPGETVDLGVDLIAPGQSGYYRGNWMLRSDTGQAFGIGDRADTAFWVEIQVLSIPKTNYAYDFAANFCNASWYSGASALSCAGPSQDPNGAVNLLTAPDLETRPENELALWVRPNNAGNGWVRGVYPAYTVQTGDRFIAEIGCLNGSPNCNVTFQVEYQMTNGAIHGLGAWHEVSDGKATRVDIDLSSLVGSQVQFILTVFNNGNAKDANAFWFVPRIQNFPYERQELVLSWHQIGGIGGLCDEVRVYMTGNQGEARAYDCRGGETRDVGTTKLTPGQVDQVLSWASRLKSFTAEALTGGSADGMTIGISFSGRGAGDWTEADFQAMRALASQLLAATR